MNKFKKESYITQRYNEPTKSWSFRVRVPNHKEKFFNEITYGSPRLAFDEAINYRNKCYTDLTTEKINQKVLLKQVFNESYAMLPVRAETKRKQVYHFNKYIGLDKDIKDIKTSDIVMSLNKMVEKCSDDTIDHVLTIWRRIYKTALIKEYVPIDLTQKVKKPSSQYIQKKKDRSVVTTRETLDNVEERICSSFSKRDAKSVVMALEVMWYTGMRPAECFALSPKDFRNGYISVSKELGSAIADEVEDNLDSRVKQVVRACKTKDSYRLIPISLKLQEKLSNYSGVGDVMFPTEDGEYFNMNDIENRIYRLNVNFNMYQLRHTLATRLIIEMGADQRTVQEILGHSSFNMSLYYSRSNEDKKTNVLNAL